MREMLLSFARAQIMANTDTDTATHMARDGNNSWQQWQAIKMRVATCNVLPDCWRDFLSLASLNFIVVVVTASVAATMRQLFWYFPSYSPSIPPLFSFFVLHKLLAPTDVDDDNESMAMTMTMMMIFAFPHRAADNVDFCSWFLLLPASPPLPTPPPCS